MHFSLNPEITLKTVQKSKTQRYLVDYNVGNSSKCSRLRHRNHQIFFPNLNFFEKLFKQLINYQNSCCFIFMHQMNQLIVSAPHHSFTWDVGADSSHVSGSHAGHASSPFFVPQLLTVLKIQLQ